jgi:hypothetical protein
LEVNLLKNERWKNHPWNENENVFLIPVEFIKSYSNPQPTDTTDLLNGDIVRQELVWENILSVGMVEPLLMLIGLKNKTLRLESGNHRINLAIKDNITHLPVAFLASNQSIIHEGNGKHFFCAKKIIKYDLLINCPYYYQVNPIDVFNNMSHINNKVVKIKELQ